MPLLLGMPKKGPACVTTLLQTVMNAMKVVSLVVVMLPLDLAMVVCSILVCWTMIWLRSTLSMKREPRGMDILPKLIHAPCVVMIAETECVALTYKCSGLLIGESNTTIFKLMCTTVNKFSV